MFCDALTAQQCGVPRRLRAAILCLALSASTSAGWASSLNYCQGDREPTAAVQDRLMRVASIVKTELEGSGQRMALVARSGLALQRLKQRYSHAGIALKQSANAPWSVRQLYYACDAQRPRIFDQGMAGFVLGAHDPAEGYISIVLLPEEAADALEHAALDDRSALQLLGGNYSANAYAFSQTYQNCNQWLVELLALAWGTEKLADASRAQTQRWLREAGYEPSVLHLGWRALIWLADWLPWLHTDDHPQDDLAAAQLQVSMPQSIEAFVHARLPEATRIELCYTEQQVVLHHGWEPIPDGCQSSPGDEVLELATR